MGRDLPDARDRIRRYHAPFFVLGSTKLQELEWHIHAVLFLFCLGWAYLKDAHVRIDLVRERLSDRAQKWVELIGCLMFLIPYAVIVIFYGVDWWHRSFIQNESAASATGLPYRWIIKAALPDWIYHSAAERHWHGVSENRSIVRYTGHGRDRRRTRTTGDGSS